MERVGVDTVRLSYPVTTAHWGLIYGNGWSDLKCKYGSVGPVWWKRVQHEDGTEVTFKGVGDEPYMLWEGSVPGYLNIKGPAPGEAVHVVDRHIRSLLPRWLLKRPAIRRCDATADILDPERAWFDAARGWEPHSRSRYYEKRIADRIGEPVNSVFLANKTRGVRVYDKFMECGEEWARDITRVEYQVRGDWLERYGLDRVYEDLGRNIEATIGQLVSDLSLRVGR